MPTVRTLLPTLLAAACAIGCGPSPSGQPPSLSQGEREYLDAHPESRVLRAPGGKALADELVTSLETVGLKMTCARHEADVPRAIWRGFSTEDKRMLAAAAARYCDGQPPRITLRERETSHVVATVGALGTVSLQDGQ